MRQTVVDDPRRPGGEGALIDADHDVAYFRTRYSLLEHDQRSALQDLARIAGFRSTSDPLAWLDADERAQLSAFLGGPPVV